MSTATRTSILEQYVDQGRVRVTIEGRKMSVPGKVSRAENGHLILTTNWGLTLDLSKEKVTKIEAKDLDSGRFTSAPKPAAA